MTDQAPERETLEKNERDLFQAADVAYFKAGNTSDPQDWLQAALLARQHRNALTKLWNTRPPSERPVAQVREALEEAIDVFAGMNDDEINEELLPRLRTALTAERPEAAVGVTDEMVERAWAAIVGDDIAPRCFNASIIRADLKAGLLAALSPAQRDIGR